MIYGFVICDLRFVDLRFNECILPFLLQKPKSVIPLYFLQCHFLTLYVEFSKLIFRNANQGILMDLVNLMLNMARDVNQAAMARVAVSM